MQNPQHEDTPRGISNDQTATKAGRARAILLDLLPQGATVTTMPARRYTSTDGNSVYEYYLLTTHPQHGFIVLLNRYLRHLRFGVNRTRCTIRSSDGPIDLVRLLGIRLYGDPDAFHLQSMAPDFY